MPECATAYNPIKIFSIGHVNEYPTMQHFGNFRDTQSMTLYIIVTEYFWKFQREIALWECCCHALFKGFLLVRRSYIQTEDTSTLTMTISKKQYERFHVLIMLVPSNVETGGLLITADYLGLMIEIWARLGLDFAIFLKNYPILRLFMGRYGLL